MESKTSKLSVKELLKNSVISSLVSHLFSNILGTIKSVFHPVETVGNILSLGGNLITRPGRTIGGFKDQIADCIETDTVKCLGKATAFVGTTFAGTKAFGKNNETSKLSKTKAAGDTAVDLAEEIAGTTAALKVFTKSAAKDGGLWSRIKGGMEKTVGRNGVSEKVFAERLHAMG
jgi:hypothetical protein